jgi:hypothetical protein
MLAVAAAAMSYAQSPAETASRAQIILSTGELFRGPGAGSGQSEQGEIVREIDDPHTGDRWLLMRDDAVPGGPGRMVLIAAHRHAPAGMLVRSAPERVDAVLGPVIRAGDRLVVEEHTAIADARLEARALNPATVGSAFNVRLTVGGRVVRAVALASGHAVLEPDTGVRP